MTLRKFMFERMKDFDRQPEEDVLHFAEQMLVGLCFLHENKIIHQDLRPENIFVTPNNNIVLADFGLAKWEAQLDKEIRE